MSFTTTYPVLWRSWPERNWANRTWDITTWPRTAGTPGSIEDQGFPTIESWFGASYSLGAYDGLLWDETDSPPFPPHAKFGANPVIIRGRGLPSGSKVLMALLIATDGDPLVLSDVSAIEYTITDLNTNLPVAGHEAVHLDKSQVVATEVRDSLDNALWKRRSSGYNLFYRFGPTAFPLENRRYRGEMLLTLTDGARCPCVFEFVTERISN